MLIWRNVAPFREIIVHRNVYPHQFPLLHKNAVEHKVDYKAPSSNKVGEVWEYNGAVTLDRNRGQMSVVGENEAMNILSLNLAHEILTGKDLMNQQELSMVKRRWTSSMAEEQIILSH